jgi:hypothetical protein
MHVHCKLRSVIGNTHTSLYPCSYSASFSHQNSSRLASMCQEFGIYDSQFEYIDILNFLMFGPRVVVRLEIHL